MNLSSTRSRLYLGFYELYFPACRRYRSSTSAIKRGLQAEIRKTRTRKFPEDQDRFPKSAFRKGTPDAFDRFNETRSSGSNGPKRFDKPQSTGRQREDAAHDRSTPNRSSDRKTPPSKNGERRFGEKSNDAARHLDRSDRFRSFESTRDRSSSNRSSDRRGPPSTTGETRFGERSHEAGDTPNRTDRFNRSDSARDRFSVNRSSDWKGPPSTNGERKFKERSNEAGHFPNHTGRFNSSDRQPRRDDRTERPRRDKDLSGTKSPRSEEDRVPVSIPYTTAASVFLYGANPVLAALRGKQRKAYSLFLTSRASNNPIIREILDLAKQSGIKVNEDASPRLLDKMTIAGTEEGESRPHNGVVLEASKLPAPPALALGFPNQETRHVQLTLDSQSVEERSINGNRFSLRFPSHRQPFVLFVDGITDPGNLGNILRTAHFYNVDAVAVATNTCAPLTSAVLAKASAGACEAVPIISLPKPANFIFDSRKAGWQVYAAAPAPSDSAASSSSSVDSSVARKLTTASLQTEKPLVEQPCILMLGAEGEGLRANLTAKADRFISIEQGLRDGGSVDVGVESLNVSVAAGVLIEAFMRETESTGAQLHRQRKEEKLF